jgi:hypothetical protein
MKGNARWVSPKNALHRILRKKETKKIILYLFIYLMSFSGLRWPMQLKKVYMHRICNGSAYSISYKVKQQGSRTSHKARKYLRKTEEIGRLEKIMKKNNTMHDEQKWSTLFEKYAKGETQQR